MRAGPVLPSLTGPARFVSVGCSMPPLSFPRRTTRGSECTYDAAALEQQHPRAQHEIEYGDRDAAVWEHELGRKKAEDRYRSPEREPQVQQQHDREERLRRCQQHLVAL